MKAMKENSASARNGSNENDIPIGDRAPTKIEWDMLAARSKTALNGRTFTPTKTLEQVWGLDVKRQEWNKSPVPFS